MATIEHENGKKRSADEPQISNSQSASRPRLHNKDSKLEKLRGDTSNNNDRWRVHSLTEDYVNMVGDMMYPQAHFGPYGHEPEKGRFPFERICTLGYLTNPLRKPTVLEKWNPYEIAVFEASITLYGKNFHRIHKQIQTKSVKETIEFYYDWKKTNHYQQWKKSYIPDERDTATVYLD